MRKIFIVGLLMIGVGLYIHNNSADSHLDSFPSCASAKPADQCIKELLREESATVAQIADGLNIDYTAPIVTFGTGKTSFLLNAKQAIPDLFQRLPKINRISLIQHLPSKDARGNEGTVKGLAVIFSRANAATVRWDNILLQDIPKFADSYWQHPSFSES